MTTEVTTQSWFSRLMESIQGVLFGLLLFVLAFPLLFWNEGRAVKTAQSLAEGAGAVLSVTADEIDTANDGKLIHLTGQATTDETLTDQQFAISVPKALRLRRSVEMYQWQQDEKKEKRKKLGGGEETVTTYTYQKVWSSSLIDSSEFKEEAHDNPTGMPFEARQEKAEKVTVGAFLLGDLLEQMSNWEDQPVTAEQRDDLPADLRNELEVHNGVFYYGLNPTQPEIGDTRIRFEAIEPAQVSIVAVQSSDTFAPYTAKTGGSSIFRLQMGQHTADDMFGAMEAENNTMTWILRLVGFVMMFGGISMVFRPLVVVADVVPLFGDLLGMGVGMVAFVIAAPLTLGTIAVGWITYRPLIGIALLVLAAGAVFLVLKLKKKS